MKHMKKLASVLLALVMAAALTAPAWAADATAVVLSNGGASTGHTLTAGQIFKAPAADKSSLEKEDLKWGDNVDEDKLWDALAAAYPNVFNSTTKPADLGSDEGAQAVAKLIADNFEKGSKYSTVDANAKLAQVIAESGAFSRWIAVDGKNSVFTGYCVIIDELGSEKSYMLWTVTESATVNPKKGETKLEKEVQVPELDKTETGVWSDAAVYTADQAGNSTAAAGIKFKVTITLPDDFSKYTNATETSGYNIVLHDTQDAGLTFGAIQSIVLYRQNGTVGQDIKSSGEYTVQYNTQDGCTFEIAIENVQNLTGAEARGYIEVIYTASFNGDTVTGAAGNNNKVTLKVNEEGDWESNVKVFELELNADKVDGDGEPLSGAQFTLYSENEWDTAKNEPKADAAGTVLGITGDSANHHYIKGLAAGTYYLVETKTPVDYIGIDPIKIEITAKTAEIEGPQAGTLTVTVTGDDFEVVDGVVTGGIRNVKGVQLPETGGIGTTIFYIAGGILAVGAVVLLITKRRVSSDED